METAHESSIIERIKTFEDACKELGDNHPYVVQYKEIYNCFLNGAKPKDIGDLVAYMKLRIVAIALNEGWKPNFGENECRWYPWFNLYTEKEVREMGEEERNAKKVLIHQGQCSLVGVSCSYSGSSDAPYSIPCHSYKSEDLAIYAGQQFIEIYAEFLFGALIKE